MPYKVDINEFPPIIREFASYKKTKLDSMATPEV
jgi:hypothetical protein